MQPCNRDDVHMQRAQVIVQIPELTERAKQRDDNMDPNAPGITNQEKIQRTAILEARLKIGLIPVNMVRVYDQVYDMNTDAYVQLVVANSNQNSMDPNAPGITNQERVERTAILKAILEIPPLLDKGIKN